jgi:hypothetical protein
MHGAGIIATGYPMDAIAHEHMGTDEIVPTAEFATDLRSIAADCH